MLFPKDNAPPETVTSVLRTAQARSRATLPARVSRAAIAMIPATCTIPAASCQAALAQQPPAEQHPEQHPDLAGRHIREISRAGDAGGHRPGIRSGLEKVTPSKTTVERGIQLAVKNGKLTGLIVEGRAGASLKVTFEWGTEPSAAAPPPEAEPNPLIALFRRCMVCVLHRPVHAGGGAIMNLAQNC